MDEVTDLKTRLQLLKSLKRLLVENDSEIIDCLSDDLKRNEFDSFSAEILHLNSEINFSIKNLKSWVKKTNHRGGGIHWPN